MLTLTLTLLLGAPPAPGSSWKWSYDDSRKMKLLSGPPGGALSAYPHLEKTELELTVDDVGEHAPRAITFKVLKGPAALAGRSWKADSSYGEAALTELGKPKNLDEVTSVERKEALALQGVLKHLLGTLFLPDPIVVAAATDPCSEATREKIAKAAGKLAARLISERSDELQTEKASAQCVGTGGKYTVAFSLTAPTQDDQKFEYPWKGTIELPEGAWRASVQLSSASTVEVKTSARPIRIQSQLSLKSVMTNKK